jgi:hypothetical protein
MKIQQRDLWYKRAIIYSVDVETFYDSDGDGVGDLQGLIQRLDYLESLGINCLWLLPFFPSPNLDNRYDVEDYYTVDPVLGSLGDFTELVHQAEHRGMRIIIDLVVNHTSRDHPWFQAAREDPELALPRLLRLGRRGAGDRRGERLPRPGGRHLVLRRQGEEMVLAPLLPPPA